MASGRNSRKNVEEAKEQTYANKIELLAESVSRTVVHNCRLSRFHKIVALSETGFTFANQVKGEELTDDTKLNVYSRIETHVVTTTKRS
jgi:hypothetical protein